MYLFALFHIAVYRFVMFCIAIYYFTQTHKQMCRVLNGWNIAAHGSISFRYKRRLAVVKSTATTKYNVDQFFRPVIFPDSNGESLSVSPLDISNCYARPPGLIVPFPKVYVWWNIKKNTIKTKAFQYLSWFLWWRISVFER